MSNKKVCNVSFAETGNFSSRRFLKRFPLSVDWGARFLLEGEDDFAFILMRFSDRFDASSPEVFLKRRLAVHEAVLNAIAYGGEKAVLTAFGKKNFMQVEICQKNKIEWPAKRQSHQGITLIERYASSVSFSSDKKTLILQFC